MRNYILLFLLFASFVFGQETNSLVLKIRENQALMKNNIERRFQRIIGLRENSTKGKKH